MQKKLNILDWTVGERRVLLLRWVPDCIYRGWNVPLVYSEQSSLSERQSIFWWMCQSYFCPILFNKKLSVQLLLTCGILPDHLRTPQTTDSFKKGLKTLHATHTAEMVERSKRSKVWLNFTRLDVDNARCQKGNKSLAFKGGNTSNLSKHLAKVHHIQTEKCTVFDCLSSSSVAPRFHVTYVMYASNNTQS